MPRVIGDESEERELRTAVAFTKSMNGIQLGKEMGCFAAKACASRLRR
jgi:hypothetical protein